MDVYRLHVHMVSSACSALEVTSLGRRFHVVVDWSVKHWPTQVTNISTKCAALIQCVALGGVASHSGVARYACNWEQSGNTHAWPTISPELLIESAVRRYKGESDGMRVLRSLISLWIQTTACKPAPSTAKPSTSPRSLMLRQQPAIVANAPGRGSRSCMPVARDQKKE